MTKKVYFTMALATLLGGLLVYANRDWFAGRPIQISHRHHAFGSRFGADSSSAPVLFEFSRKLKLTSIKVIPVNTPQTNRFTLPVWHLVSDSNSLPTRGFVYGMDVPGMRPTLKGAAADPLDPAQKYRLLIEAGSTKAEHDFGLETQ